MNKKIAQLELLKVFQLDALELISAHDRCKVIHTSKDISAAGDEVEITFRQILYRKLPNRYYVGHGHVVDSALNSSPQFDVVIADNTNAPILFRTQKGSEYFPYESVYAVGEVKSTYYKKDAPIETFVNNLSHTKLNLTRENTQPDETGLGIRFSEPLTKSPYRNPLFSFMIFIESNDFIVEDLREYFLSTNVADLPNIICFLDVGIIVNTQVNYEASGKLTTGFINTIPEFNTYSTTGENRFMFCPSSDKVYGMGSHLSNLFFVLLSHLEECKLRPSGIKNYLLSMMSFEDLRMVDWEPSLNIRVLRALVDDPEVEQTPYVKEVRRVLDLYDSSDEKDELRKTLNQMVQKK